MPAINTNTNINKDEKSYMIPNPIYALGGNVMDVANLPFYGANQLLKKISDYSWPYPNLNDPTYYSKQALYNHPLVTIPESSLKSALSSIGLVQSAPTKAIPDTAQKIIPEYQNVFDTAFMKHLRFPKSKTLGAKSSYRVIYKDEAGERRQFDTFDEDVVAQMLHSHKLGNPNIIDIQQASIRHGKHSREMSKEAMKIQGETGSTSDYLKTYLPGMGTAMKPATPEDIYELYRTDPSLIEEFTKAGNNEKALDEFQKKYGEKIEYLLNKYNMTANPIRGAIPGVQ